MCRPQCFRGYEPTPAEIRKELAMAKRQAEVRIVASEVPQFSCFRTSGGGQGILQLQVGPMVHGSHQIHVRYKLLSPRVTGRAAALDDGVDASVSLKAEFTRPSPWADPNLSSGLATLVWRALAEPLEVEGRRYVWLSTTLAPPACAVRGEIDDGRGVCPGCGRNGRAGETVHVISFV